MKETTWKAIGRAGNAFAMRRGAQPSHTIWEKAWGGKPIFTLLPNGAEPNTGDGGYYSLESALTLRGLVRVSE